MNKENLNKKDAYAILTGIATASLIISNILAFKTFTFWEIVLPCAVIIFPIVYITNDVLAEIYGFEKARQVIYLGFVMNLVAVLLFNIAIALPAPSYFTGSEAFETVLSNSLRVLIASFMAYLFGSILNAYLMSYLKKKSEKQLFLRCIVSTIGGEGLDAVIFITVAFYGTMPTMALLVMIISQAMFKTLYEIIIYPLTRKVINHIHKLPE